MKEARYRGLAYETARLKLAQIRVEGRQSRDRAYQSLAQVSAEAISADRVAVFSVIHADDALVNECTYLSKTSTFVSEPRLERMADLLRALQRRRLIVANDAAKELDLGAFSSAYLAANKVASALCAPIIREGRVTGLLTFERCGAVRPFTQEQLSFASSAADLMALILEQAARVELEAALHANSQLHHENLKMQALVRLSRVVAHDLNGLLAVVGMVASELSRVEAGEGAPLSTDLKGVVEMGRRLTDSLLTFGAVNPPADEKLDLARAIEDMLPIFRPLFSDGRELRFVQQTEHVTAFIDALSFQQVLLNLVRNARDALAETGVVSVRLRAPDAGDSLRVGAVVLDVEDNGQGMDEETQTHAAEPYFTTKSDGHGLGLSTVFGIAQRYSGGVRLRSTLGQGTCVSVAFQRR